MPSDTPLSTDADLASTALRDDHLVEGEHASPNTSSALINRPRDELYTFWRRFENLPHFMNNLKAVTVDGDRSEWIVKGPMGDLTLTSQITEDAPGRRIAWTSADDSQIRHEGWVSFDDNRFGRGTEVRLFVSYDPPGGARGKFVAKVAQHEPRIQARRELRRFKQLMETGEISTSEAPDAAPRG